MLGCWESPWVSAGFLGNEFSSGHADCFCRVRGVTHQLSWDKFRLHFFLSHGCVDLSLSDFRLFYNPEIVTGVKSLKFVT